MYRQNDTASAIRQIQEYLYEIHLYENLPLQSPIDGIYGKETQIAIAEFQKRMGLLESGIVDLVTFEALRDNALKYRSENKRKNFLYAKEGFPLRRGSSGADIDTLHALLRSLSAFDKDTPPIPRTAYFSNETENAVRYFQKRFMKDITGIVDAELYERLELELAGRRAFL
ncbi:MAG: peptidoglycan-binding protein [Clostridia bacterium]|nr:peptidoglycan-binding protein [Clostridia bacterium]